MKVPVNIVIIASLLSLSSSLSSPTPGDDLASLVLRQDGGIPEVTNVTIADMTFEGPAFVDGPNVTLTGTIEQVHTKLVELNPNYDTDFGIDTEDDEDDNSDAGLEKRRWRGNCKLYSHRKVAEETVDGDIKYLHGVTASCGMQANACTRVACVDGGGIYACTAGHKLNVRCDRIARLARRITKHCFSFDSHGTRWTWGRDFSGDGWAVDIAGTDDC